MKTIKLWTPVLAAALLAVAGCEDLAGQLGLSPAACNLKAAKNVAFISVGANDTLVAEAFGETCEEARLLFYVEGAEGLIEPLHLGLLRDYATNGLSADNAGAVLEGALDLAHSGESVPFETYAELEFAGTQPNGNPWRGTPLVRAEYDRLVAASPRKLIIPTDLSRAKMMVWDEAVLGRPVLLVYYGD